MKARMCIAAVLLILVGFGCFFSVSHLEHRIERLNETINKIENAFARQDYDACLRLSKQFYTQFTKETRFLPFYIRHKDIGDVEDAVCVLPDLLERKDYAQFAAYLALCRVRMERLRQSEIPTPENIL